MATNLTRFKKNATGIEKPIIQTSFRIGEVDLLKNSTVDTISANEAKKSELILNPITIEKKSDDNSAQTLDLSKRTEDIGKSNEVNSNLLVKTQTDLRSNMCMKFLEKLRNCFACCFSKRVKSICKKKKTEFLLCAFLITLSALDLGFFVSSAYYTKYFLLNLTFNYDQDYVIFACVDLFVYLLQFR